MAEYPSIKDAKELATKYRRKAVIVLSFGDGHYHMASFGHNRKLCDAARLVVETISDHITDGSFGLPEALLD